ncbi:hypothetical protein ACH4E7_40175 [Kitasatospora sp. NPDC018058]|uniref:hypothetical protein n=1 Tax=Kitasatospora sp. NPDC018058 TaxID=3364025 RepID=UPI0037BF9F39
MGLGQLCRAATEQHVHSFLKSRPPTALSILGCLRLNQLRALRQGVTGRQPLRLRPTWRRPPLPSRHLAGVIAATAVLAAPYGEEFLRRLIARRHGCDGELLAHGQADARHRVRTEIRQTSREDGAMSTRKKNHTPQPDESTPPPDEKTRERSAEERHIVAPTPKDVRAKAENDETPEPPPADTKAP